MTEIKEILIENAITDKSSLYFNKEIINEQHQKNMEKLKIYNENQDKLRQQVVINTTNEIDKNLESKTCLLI